MLTHVYTHTHTLLTSLTYHSLSSARHAVEGFAAIFCAPSVSLAALGGHTWSNILVVFSGLKLICCFYIWLSLN